MENKYIKRSIIPANPTNDDIFDESVDKNNTTNTLSIISQLASRSGNTAKIIPAFKHMLETGTDGGIVFLESRRINKATIQSRIKKLQIIAHNWKQIGDLSSINVIDGIYNNWGGAALAGAVATYYVKSDKYTNALNIDAILDHYVKDGKLADQTTKEFKQEEIEIIDAVAQYKETLRAVEKHLTRGDDEAE